MNVCSWNFVLFWGWQMLPLHRTPVLTSSPTTLVFWILAVEWWTDSLIAIAMTITCKQQMEISQIHVEQVCQDKRPELCPVTCLGSLPFQEARKELKSNRWIEVMPCLTTDLKLTRFLPGGPSFAIYFNNTSYKKSFQRGKVLVTRRGCR